MTPATTKKQLHNVSRKNRNGRDDRMGSNKTCPNCGAPISRGAVHCRKCCNRGKIGSSHPAAPGTQPMLHHSKERPQRVYHRGDADRLAAYINALENPGYD